MSKPFKAIVLYRTVRAKKALTCNTCKRAADGFDIVYPDSAGEEIQLSVTLHDKEDAEYWTTQLNIAYNRGRHDQRREA